MNPETTPFNSRPINVGFNGLGRIGKNLARTIVSRLDDRFHLVAANDLASPEVIAASLPRDSIHGRFPSPVEVLSGGRCIRIGRHELALYAEKDPAAIPWKSHAVDVVFECTGFFTSTEKAEGHLSGGAGRVIISAPCKDDTKTVVVGVNQSIFTSEDRIVSNASCTTNCLAPLVKSIDDSFPVIGGLMSTTHASTGSDRILDAFGTRGALNNIIPGSTGAAIAIGKVLPHLAGKLNGSSLRVPVDTGSVVEAVLLIEGRPSREELLAAMRANVERINANTPLGTVVSLGSEYECSRDAVGEPWSSMISDAIQLIPASEGTTLVKVTSFYDNETGYAVRMAELALLMMTAK